MNRARLLVLATSIGAAALAGFMLLGRKGPEPVVAAAPPPQAVAMADVLVAGTDIATGKTLALTDLKWQPWPAASVSEKFMRKDQNPKALDEAIGAIARYPFAVGEPIRAGRIVKTGGKGYMAAMLTPGMRGISIDVTAEQSASGFILPNDQVDVILTRRLNADATTPLNAPTHATSTVLQSVRVLAVDQTVDDPNNAKAVQGRTVTLELTPPQAEILAQARQTGTLSLSLRSVADAGSMPLSGTDDSTVKETGTSVTVVRFGVPRAVSTSGAK